VSNNMTDGSGNAQCTDAVFGLYAGLRELQIATWRG